MDLADALAFARAQRNGVLVTLRRDGRPQLSNILYDLGDDDVVRVSVTVDRAKTRNLARDPRASLYVSSPDFWSYVVLEGDAELGPQTTEPGDAGGLELREVYRRIRGEEHPDWDDFDRAMVRERRLVVRLRPTRAYGLRR